MPTVQPKSCEADDKPGKNEVEYHSRVWMFHKECPDCDTKRSAPCQNCSSK
jgi:hypothetical protein